MPLDNYYDEDDEKSEASSTKGRFKEFDCPSCNANNPCGDAFGDGDEVLCNYCGTEYKARVGDDGKLRLREL